MEQLPGRPTLIQDQKKVPQVGEIQRSRATVPLSPQNSWTDLFGLRQLDQCFGERGFYSVGFAMYNKKLVPVFPTDRKAYHKRVYQNVYCRMFCTEFS
jgi:hypothetical protein